MTRVTVARQVPDAATLMTAPPVVWLPPPARPAGPNRWAVDLRLGRLRRAVVVELGPVWNDGERLGRPLSWHTDPEDGDVLPYELLLPIFRGTLVAVAADEVVLDGRYDPPFRAFGRAADGLLRRLAERTVRHFLEDVRVHASAMAER